MFSLDKQRQAYAVTVTTTVSFLTLFGSYWYVLGTVLSFCITLLISTIVGRM